MLKTTKFIYTVYIQYIYHTYNLYSIYTRKSNLFFPSKEANLFARIESLKLSPRRYPVDHEILDILLRMETGTGLIHRVRTSCLVERDPEGNRPITCWLVKYGRREEGKIKRDQTGEGVV